MENSQAHDALTEIKDEIFQRAKTNEKKQTSDKKKKAAINKKSKPKKLFDLPSATKTGGKAGTPQSPAKKRINRRGKKSKRKNSYCWWGAPVIAFSLLIIGFAVMLGLKEYVAYAAFENRMESALKETFYEGVCVDNYELAGFDLEDALSAFYARVEKKFRQRSLCFEIGEEDGFLITAEELGYQSNYEKVISEAWNYGRSGSLEERYRSINGVSSNKINYPVNRTLYDPGKLRAITDSIAKAYTKEKREAGIAGFDFATCTFTYTGEEAGSYVDAEKLYKDACALFANGGGLLSVKIESISPETTLENVQTCYGMITSAVTSASSSSNNRLINLNLACKAITGTAIEPGETFSFNTVVGKRTKQKGYTIAPVYTNGEVGTDIGGGVCQVSTTLWNAAMKADCEIVERHAHSRPVSYVDKGKDATVSWDSQDMSFKNTTDGTLYIVAYLREDKRVVTEIYGKLMPDGNYIKIEAKTTKRIQPGDPVRVYNPQLNRHQEVVVSEARTGYKAEAYRVYYDSSDTEIRRELLCTSYYKEAAGRIEYNN